MRCPYCGSSNLVWDYQRGEVVCTTCATVIDKIYIAVKPRYNADTDSGYSHLYSNYSMPKLKKETKNYLKILEDIGGKKRKDMTIDTGAFWEYMRTGRRVKLLKRRVNMKYSSDTTVQVAMDILKKYPKLTSRTDRAKLVIALLALALIKGVKLDTSLISKEVGLSKVHIKRLEKLIRREKAFIEELKEAFSRMK
ncbi:MAG: hypothetical protein J7J11_01675 [Desulfurococcales archaeon]|nr:hypothetical protein [Desulfurococcales archaeon]